MYKFRYILLFLLPFIPQQTAFAQSTFDMHFSRDSLVSGEVYISIYLRAQGTPFKLGSSALFFDYDPAVLDAPSIHQSFGYVGNVSDPSLCPSGPCAYQTSHQISNTLGRTGLGINLEAPNNGALLPNTYVQIAQLTFPVLNPTGNMNLQCRGTSFQGVLEAPTVVKQDDEIISVDMNVCTGLMESPLPITLLHFDAKGRGSYIAVEWESGREVNSSGYVLERSEDGISFSQISFFEARGTTTHGVSYAYPDRNILPNKSYHYRLKMVDLDGTTTYSPVVTAQVVSDEVVFVGEIYPNPAVSEAFIDLWVNEEEQMTVTIVDILGREVKRWQAVYEPGLHILKVDLSAVSSGVYVISIESETSMYSRKGVKN